MKKLFILLLFIPFLNVKAEVRDNYIENINIAVNDENVSKLNDNNYNTYLKMDAKDLIKIANGECTGIRKKPCPDGVLNIVQKLDCTNSCLYVGDSEVDVQTAKNAGIPCISVSWGYKDKNFLKEHDAKIIVDSIDELTTIILAYK